MKKKQLETFDDVVEFDTIMREYTDLSQPLEMNKEALEKYWVMAGEHEDCRIFDLDPDKIEYNIYRGLTYMDPTHADLVEKDGVFILLGNHIENGVVDFGGNLDVKEEDLFDIDGTLHEKPIIDIEQIENQ